MTRSETASGWRLTIDAQGLLVSKNDALEAKYLDGYRRGSGRCPQASSANAYNDKARAVRELVAMLAKPIGPVTGPVYVSIDFNPKTSWDDDAGAIMVTWIVDGLTDAGLWQKDRRVISWLTFRTVRDSAAPAIAVYIDRVPS